MKFSASDVRECTELKKWCKEAGADLGQIDILVEDIKFQEANRINSNGLWAQICFLYSKGSSAAEIKSKIKKEITTLQRYQMARQSKTVPELNVRLKPKRKRD